MRRYAVIDELDSPTWRWCDYSYIGHQSQAVHFVERWRQIHNLFGESSDVDILATLNHPHGFSILAELTKIQLEHNKSSFDTASGDAWMLLSVLLLAWMTLQLCMACCLHPIATASRCLS